jgi:hypothetical protein
MTEEVKVVEGNPDFEGDAALVSIQVSCVRTKRDDNQLEPRKYGIHPLVNAVQVLVKADDPRLGFLVPSSTNDSREVAYHVLRSLTNPRVGQSVAAVTLDAVRKALRPVFEETVAKKAKRAELSDESDREDDEPERKIGGDVVLA